MSEARRFVANWLWQAPQRDGRGRVWTGEFIEDAIQMVHEASGAARREELDACAEIADKVLAACIFDDERGIATTIRNLILARGMAPKW